jgi:hypothetical protein
MKFLNFWLFIFFVVHVQVLAYGNSDGLIDRVQREAPIAWESYLRSTDKCGVTFHEVGIAKGETVIDFTATFLCFDPCFVYEVQKANSKIIVASNEKYEFTLHCPKGDDIVVRDIIPITNQTSNLYKTKFPILYENDSRSVELLVGRTLARGLMVSAADWLPVLFAQPEFLILDARELVEDGEQLVWIKYSYQPPQRRNQFARDGEVYLFPKHYWLLKRAKLLLVDTNKTQVHSTVICNYDFTDDTNPKLLSHELYTEEYDQLLKREFKDYKTVQKIDHKRFTLSHYGFKEPDFDDSRRINCIRYVLIGLGCLLLIIAIWRLRKRQM